MRRSTSAGDTRSLQRESARFHSDAEGLLAFSTMIANFRSGDAKRELHSLLKLIELLCWKTAPGCDCTISAIDLGS